MTEIEVVQPATMELVVPGSGEVVNLEDPAQVARALRWVRDIEEQFKLVKDDLTAALALEAERQGTGTFESGTHKVEVSFPTTYEWDVAELQQRLAEEGLPEERLAALVKTEVSYKVSQSEAKKIAARNERYAEIIDSCRRAIPGKPRAKVDPLP